MQRSSFVAIAGVLVIGLLGFHSSLVAQKKVTPPTVPHPGTPGSTPNSPGTTNTNPNPTTQGDMYVSGRVAMSDGSAVPINVVIERVCGNRRQALGYTDSKGNFSVRLTGSSIASMVDASDDHSAGINARSSPGFQRTTSSLMGCEVQASYAGYRSAAVDVGSRKSLDNPDIGTIVLRHASGNGSGTVVSESMLAAPKNALKAYDHGMEALRKGKMEDATKDFEKAVALHPGFANAWYELGHVKMSGDSAVAKADLEKAVAADPKYILPYSDLALLATVAKNWEEVIGITERGLKLDGSGSPQLYYYNAIAHFNLGDSDAAEKRVREAIKADYDHRIPKTSHLLSVILARKGDFGGAAEQMRAYLATSPMPADAERAQAQLKQIEAKAAETVKQ